MYVIMDRFWPALPVLKPSTWWSPLPLPLLMFGHLPPRSTWANHTHTCTWWRILLDHTFRYSASDANFKCFSNITLFKSTEFWSKLTLALFAQWVFPFSFFLGLEWFASQGIAASSAPFIFSTHQWCLAMRQRCATDQHTVATVRQGKFICKASFNSKEIQSTSVLLLYVDYFFCLYGASGVCYRRQLTQCYTMPSVCVALKGWSYTASHFSDAAERSGWAATTTTWHPGSGQNTETHLNIMQWTWITSLSLLCHWHPLLTFCSLSWKWYIFCLHQLK